MTVDPVISQPLRGQFKVNLVVTGLGLRGSTNLHIPKPNTPRIG
jgi:hypothetical protein